MKIRLDSILRERDVSLYRLALDTELNRSALTRLRLGKTASIEFDTLERICKRLKCTPNDLLEIESKRIAA